MIDLLHKGGVLMWLLFAASVIGFGVTIERLTYFHRISIATGTFLKGLINSLRDGRVDEALREARSTPGPVARVVAVVIESRKLNRSDLRTVAAEAGQLEVENLERHLPALAAVAQISPLIGLLGTVVGMLKSFLAISAQTGFVTVSTLSAGISTSLLTTAAGFCVAIPAQLAYLYLSARVNRMLHEVERAGIEIIRCVESDK